MTARSPRQKHQPEQVVALREGPGAHADGEVVTPSDDLGRQDPDQQVLLGASMSVHHLVELVDVPLDAGLAWFDESLVSEQPSLVVLGASGLSGPIMPNVETQEVETRLLLPC